MSTEARVYELADFHPETGHLHGCVAAVCDCAAALHCVAEELARFAFPPDGEDIPRGEQEPPRIRHRLRCRWGFELCRCAPCAVCGGRGHYALRCPRR